MKYLDIIDLEPKIEIMDIGAAAIAETPIYTKLIDEKIATLNAFEGDKRQSNKLKSKYENNIKLYDEFLFDGSIQNLYFSKLFCKDSCMALIVEMRSFFNSSISSNVF